MSGITSIVSRVFLTLGLVLVSVAGSSIAVAQAPTAAQGKVKVEWLGHNGHSTLIADLALYASVYQPDLAILGLAGDPPEFAQVARLMTTNNPKLRTVIPSHMRPGAPILIDGKRELDRLGIAGLMFVPELRKAYEY